MTAKKFADELFSREMLMYMLFGVGTAAIDYFSEIFFYNHLTFSTNSAVVVTANTLSFVLSVTFAFVTNKLFVFKSKSGSGHELRVEALKFFSARSLTFLLSLIGMVLFVDTLSLGNEISKILVSIGVVIINYVFSKCLIFTDRDESDSSVINSKN